MSADSESDTQLEIGHVLFIDIVGYSKLMVDEQEKAASRLNHIVRGTEEFGNADAARKLLRFPTGDGMVLVFFGSPEAPLRCAVEITKRLKETGQIALRMGIHSGPVRQLTDVDGRTNLAGGGINIAQRVMDCGDAGHILLSRRAATDIEQHSKWRSQLHDLGECEVKHGIRVDLVSLHTEEVGNAATPAKLLQAKSARAKKRKSQGALAIAALAVVVGAGLWFYFARSSGGHFPAGGFPGKSVAVFPFKPLAGSSDDEALEAGMAETLITKLSATREIIVPSLSSVRKFSEQKLGATSIARELHVNCILEGSLQKAGANVRVTARLLRASDGSSLWAKQFDKKFTDLFDVQDAIAQEVAAALALTLSEEERERLTKRYTDNTEAYQLYVKGRFHWNKYTEPDWRKSIEYFNQAISLDRNYALAYSGLADSYSLLGEMAYAPAHDVFPQARTNAQKALALDEKLASAHLSLGIVKLFYEWDFEGAGEHLRRAKELDPHNPQIYHFYGHYLELTKRLEEGIAETRKGIREDPTNLIVNAELAFAFYLARQPDPAIEQAHQTLALDRTFVYAATLAAQAYEQKGMLKEAMNEVDRALPVSDNWSWLVGEKGYIYALLGQRDGAEKAIADLTGRSPKEYVDPVLVAYIYIGLNDADQAFNWMEKALADRSGMVGWVQIEPKFDRIRSDPRFAALTKRMGLQ